MVFIYLWCPRHILHWYLELNVQVIYSHSFYVLFTIYAMVILTVLVDNIDVSFVNNSEGYYSVFEHTHTPTHGEQRKEYAQKE